MTGRIAGTGSGIDLTDPRVRARLADLPDASVTAAPLTRPCVYRLHLGPTPDAPVLDGSDWPGRVGAAWPAFFIEPEGGAARWTVPVDMPEGVCVAARSEEGELLASWRVWRLVPAGDTVSIGRSEARPIEA